MGRRSGSTVRGARIVRRACAGSTEEGACSPRVRTPRPVARPRASRSIQAEAYGDRSLPAAVKRASRSSRSVARSVETETSGVVTRFSRRAAERITPVSPRPPVVASKRAVPGVTVRTSPSAVRSSSASTCRASEPAPGWSWPCTSEPIAPPTVILPVPGTTGRNRPRDSRIRSSRSRVTPASQRTVAASSSRARTRSRPVMSSTEPPAFCAASPGARPSPRARAPRGPRPRTTAAASSYVRGRNRTAVVGAVRPQPVKDTVSTDMPVTVAPGVSSGKTHSSPLLQHSPEWVMDRVSPGRGVGLPDASGRVLGATRRFSGRGRVRVRSWTGSRNSPSSGRSSPG
ncbi:hypothetical protein SCYAM73S_04467 [Streptomyces cyaneofuscatus]